MLIWLQKFVMCARSQELLDLIWKPFQHKAHYCITKTAIKSNKDEANALLERLSDRCGVQNNTENTKYGLCLACSRRPLHPQYSYKYKEILTTTKIGSRIAEHQTSDKLRHCNTHTLLILQTRKKQTSIQQLKIMILRDVWSVLPGISSPSFSKYPMLYTILQKLGHLWKYKQQRK